MEFLSLCIILILCTECLDLFTIQNLDMEFLDLFTIQSLDMEFLMSTIQILYMEFQNLCITQILYMVFQSLFIIQILIMTLIMIFIISILMEITIMLHQHLDQSCTLLQPLIPSLTDHQLQVTLFIHHQHLGQFCIHPPRLIRYLENTIQPLDTLCTHRQLLLGTFYTHRQLQDIFHTLHLLQDIFCTHRQLQDQFYIHLHTHCQFLILLQHQCLPFMILLMVSDQFLHLKDKSELFSLLMKCFILLQDMLSTQ